MWVLTHPASIVSVFLHKRPHLVSRHLWGFYRLYLSVMNLLCSLTGSPNNAHHRVVCQSTGTTNASKTAAFAVGLEHLTNLLRANVTMIIKGVKAFIEGLTATRAKVPLNSTRHLAVLMNLQVSAQGAFHRTSDEVNVLLLYLTHINLTHDQLAL